MEYVNLNVYDQYNRLEEDDEYFNQVNSLYDKDISICLNSIMYSNCNLIDIVKNLKTKDIEKILENDDFLIPEITPQIFKEIIDSLKNSHQLKLLQTLKNKRKYAANKIKNFYFKTQLQSNNLNGFNKIFDDYLFLTK